MKVFNWFKNLFRSKPESFPNIYHAEFADKVEPATDVNGKQLEVNGVKYYRFKTESYMPYGRYKMLSAFIKQVDLRMTSTILNAYIDKIEQNINGEKGNVNLTKVYEIILAIRSRLKLTFEIDTTLKYASVVYFDDQENLYTYDLKHNDKKISGWQEANTIDFFYMRPMSELFGLKDISQTDLAAFIKVQQEITSDPTLEMTGL